MKYIFFCRIAAAAGWIGAFFIAPGMMDQGYPLWTSLLVGAGSLGAAWLFGELAGVMIAVRQADKLGGHLDR